MYHRWGNKLFDNSTNTQSRSEETGDALIENVISNIVCLII